MYKYKQNYKYIRTIIPTQTKPKDGTYVHEKKYNQLFPKVKLPYVPKHYMTANAEEYKAH